MIQRSTHPETLANNVTEKVSEKVSKNTSDNTFDKSLGNIRLKKVGITEVVLRDAHQSLHATRMRLDDMLPIAEQLDQIGYWSVETWGGATFDSCIRYLGEDPWERIREIKKVMPKTPQQMLLRGQNILGYRHYGDDIVKIFVERAVVNGVDVFRIFDAMNDPRNFKTAIESVIKNGQHAQAAMSYTTSPVHTPQLWIDLAKKLQDMGAHSLCIKDMAGLLKPYDAFDLISNLKKEIEIPIHLHCHATTGLSTATILKAIEAGVDQVDTSISSMSSTYGHSSTETVVAMLQDQGSDTKLDLVQLEKIASYFRQIRKKYAKFEGSLRGVDSRILIAQVPGGMLTNMENQLREQGAEDKFDQVLAEIPKVRKDLGYIPLVTPTSQIVGTQAVLNILSGNRYQTITKETSALLCGHYGATPAAVDKKLQEKVLKGAKVMTARPADYLEPEVEKLTKELNSLARENNFSLSENKIDDVLTYALFPQVGLKFLKNRLNPGYFEPIPSADEHSHRIKPDDANVYTVTVAGQRYVVQVEEGGDISQSSPSVILSGTPNFQAGNQGEGKGVGKSGIRIAAPLGGSVVKILVQTGQQVKKNEVLLILEAMKMETEIVASQDGLISQICIKEGDQVQLANSLFIIS